MKKKILVSLMAVIGVTINIGFAQWKNTGFSGVTVRKIEVKEGNIFAGTESNGAYLSADNGSSWNSLNNDPLTATTTVMAFAFKDTNIFAGTWGPGILCSPDSGLSWTNLTNGMAQAGIYSVAVCKDGSILVGTVGNGIYRSTNDGSSWSMVRSVRAYVILTDSTAVYVGTDQGFYRSVNNGADWIEVNNGISGDRVILTIVKNGDALFAGTNGNGVWYSTNVDSGWVAANTGLPGNGSGGMLPITAIAVYENNIFAGTSGSGVYVSKDKGLHWIAVNDGLSYQNIRSLGINRDTLFASTFLGGIWSRPVSEITTAVEKNNETIPDQFVLEQNYPNPFNPSTTFHFILPYRLFVSLKIYDVMGKEIATVVSEEMHSGIYERRWNALGVSSGIYFYRLQAGSFSETKKLVLIK
jgi:hypothetical protein